MDDFPDFLKKYSDDFCNYSYPKIIYKKYNFVHRNIQFSWIGPDVNVDSDDITKSNIQEYGKDGFSKAKDKSIFWCSSSEINEKFVILSSFLMQDDKMVIGPARSYIDCFKWIMSCVEDEITASKKNDYPGVQSCVECHEIVLLYSSE